MANVVRGATAAANIGWVSGECALRRVAFWAFGQRVFGLALGYEDLNDHDDLRYDPLLAAAIGKTDPKGARRARERDQGAGLAGKSTLNRIELSKPGVAPSDRYRRIVLREEYVDQVFLDVFLQAHGPRPSRYSCRL
jgi:hypothetical protein